MKIREVRLRKGHAVKTVAKYLALSEKQYLLKEENNDLFTVEEVIKLSSFFEVSVKELIKD